MQVNLTGGSGTGRSAELHRVTPLLDLGQLLQADPEVEARRAEQAEQREQRRRRRETELAEAAQGTTPALRLSEEVVRAERKMLPGSQAARREQLNEAAEARTAERRGEFRQRLTQAEANRPGQERVETPRAAEGDGETPSAGRAGKPRAPEAGGTPADTGAESAKAAGAPGPRPAGEFAPLVAAASRGSAAAPAPLATKAEGAPAAQAARVAAKVTAIRAAATTAPAKSGGPSSAGPQAEHGGTPSHLAARVAGRRSVVTAAGGEQPADAERNSEVNAERILRLIHARLGQRRSVTTLQLDPPELGRLRLRMDLQNERLALRIDAETDAARGLLLEQTDTLRRSLEAAGIQLERIEVRVPEPAVPPADAGLPQHADVPMGGHQEQASGGSLSAGGGAQPGMESTSLESAEGAAAAGGQEPAAESLVNVWA